MSPINKVISEFDRLCTARDMAAYKVVGHLECAIYACRNGNAQEALKILSEARAVFNRADADLENFKRSNPQHFKKGDPRHGNRAAA